MMGRIAGIGVLGLMMVIAGLLPTPALAQVRYNCSGGLPIFVDYGGQHAELTFLGIRYFLRQVPLAEGSRYSDGRFTWTVTRNQEGTLTHDGAIVAQGCRTTAFSQPIGPFAGNTYT
ncbi:MAG: MliC family protein, partial [Candidatus Methylomirabilaceae bacterium]